MPENIENRNEGKILKRVEYEGGEAVIRYPEEGDLEGILEAVADKRKRWQVEGKKNEIKEIDGKEINWRKKVIEAAQGKKIVYLVVEADGRAQGYIDIRKMTDIGKTDFSTLGAETCDRALVFDVTVNSNYRGRHFAQELLNTGLDEAKNILGVKEAELQTDEDNYSARKAYEKCGFKTMSIGPDAKKRDDKTVLRVHMEKQL